MIVPDYTFKICVFGDSDVGKSTLSRRYVSGKYEDDLKKTLGVEVCIKYLEIENMIITIQVWDFGGEENFRFLLPTYARGSSGGIFMFDLTKKRSLNFMEDWLKIFIEGLAPTEKSIPILMIGGKQDLENNREIKTSDAEFLKDKYNLYEYLECSSKTGNNVERIFEILTELILKKKCIL